VHAVLSGVIARDREYMRERARERVRERERDRERERENEERPIQDGGDAHLFLWMLLG